MSLCKADVKIINFTHEFAEKLYKNSLDIKVKQYLPDEVFNDINDARSAIDKIIVCYKKMKPPFVYALLNEENEYIGYVQAVRISEGYELGYNINAEYRNRGYASRAVEKFLPFIIHKSGIDSIYAITVEDNISSIRVLEKNGFSLIFKGEGNYQGENCALRKYIYKKADFN